MIRFMEDSLQNTINSHSFEAKMQSRAFCWFMNLVTTLLIFYNAEIGRLLGLSGLPLAISVVWPSTGIALAVFLLFGYSIWPGVFLGNFCYNVLHLYLSSGAYLSPLLVGLVISSGSLLQAFVGAWFIRNFSSKGYFETVKDIFIFLLPAGLIACLIASSIGVTALYLNGSLSLKALVHTWLTFWIGDTMGVYIITPLLVIWTLKKYDINVKKHIIELLFMIVCFVLLNYLTFQKGFPLWHLYIPLSLWITYEFRMHGAALSNFLIAISVIIPASFGYGPIIENFPTDSLLLLVTFLEILVAISLFFAAILNERETALKTLQNHSINLELENADLRTNTSREIFKENLLRETFGPAMSGLTLGLLAQIFFWLRKINLSAMNKLASISRLSDVIKQQEEKYDGELFLKMQTDLDTLKSGILNTSTCEREAEKVYKIIQEHPELFIQTEISIDPINLNDLINFCLNKEITETNKINPNFIPKIGLDFDQSISFSYLGLQKYLTFALRQIIHAVLNIIIEKTILDPILDVRTENRKTEIEISLSTNSLDAEQTQQLIENLGQTFMSPEKEVTNLELALANDIITQLHRGKIQIDRKDEEIVEIIVTLPKL